MLVLAVLGAVVVAGIGASLPATAAIMQSYIVVLDDSVADPAAAAEAAGVTPTHVYRHALKGYAAPMAVATAATIAARSNVRFVEPDGIATIAVTQSPATWGLDRIDQRNLPLNNSTCTRRPAPACGPTSSTRACASRTPSSAAAPRAASTTIDGGRAERLPRPRHARRRHGRRDDVGRREERHARRRPRPRLRRQRHVGPGHRRHRLGHGRPRSGRARRREYEPRRGRRKRCARHGRRELDRRRRHVRARGRQRQR